MKRILTFLGILGAAFGLQAANPAFQDLAWTNAPGVVRLRSTNSYVRIESGLLMLNTNGQQYYTIQAVGTFNENRGKPGSQIVGGNFHILTADHGTIIGGYNNQAITNAQKTFTGGGQDLQNNGEYGGMIGGERNINNGFPGNFFGGGSDNIIRSNTGHCILFGSESVVDCQDGSDFVTMLGGSENLVESKAAQVFFVNIWGGDRCKATQSETWVVGTRVTNTTTKSIEMGFYDTNKFRIKPNIVETVGGMQLASSGISSATNGFASNSTLATNQIPVSGWTNNAEINVTVYVTATAVSFTIKNRAGTVMYTSPVISMTLPVILQPGWAINAASGLVGTVLPF